jgi:hypothetical protein
MDAIARFCIGFLKLNVCCRVLRWLSRGAVDDRSGRSPSTVIRTLGNSFEDYCK